MIARAAQAVSAAPGRRASLVVVVEGPADVRAVRAAAPAAKVVHTNGKGLLDHRSDAANTFRRRVRGASDSVVVLTDPDLTGLLLRNHVDTLLGGGIRHAFVPALEATLRGNQGAKRPGDVGIQHARPESISRALQAARASDPERRVFTAADLQAYSLAVAHDAPEAGAGAATLRHQVCDLLGIGRCNGKQLLRQLNRYGFTREELEACIARARGEGAAGAAGTRGRDRNAESKVVSARSGSLPVQYAGPTPVQLLQQFENEDIDEDEDDGDWDEWDEWPDAELGVELKEV